MVTAPPLLSSLVQDDHLLQDIGIDPETLPRRSDSQVVLVLLKSHLR